MAGRLLRDPDQDGWERSDMPIVCETCLGPNPYVRMQKIPFGGECHISGRPYTVFRWRPGKDARYKKTIICQEVAKAKNVCQVCLLDLTYGLPVQVRDTALGVENDDIPQSDVGKEFQLNEHAQAGTLGEQYNDARPNDLLQRLQRTTPYYKRNMARICTFFVRGQCNRGAECPYRHEMPTSGELAEQNIKDRYYGINDPVANKILRRADEMPKVEPPEDISITTLYVGGVTTEMSEHDLRDVFYSFGEITSVKKSDAKNCAFVTFAARKSAEQAVEELSGKLIIKGNRCKLMWGKPLQPAPGTAPPLDPMQPSTRPPPSMLPPQLRPASDSSTPSLADPNFFNLPSSSDRPYYPSMDPQAMGSKLPSMQPSERRAEPTAGDEAQQPKRARHDAPPMPPPGMYPPIQYPVPHVPPLPYGAPPPMRPPPLGAHPPQAMHPGMPPPGMGPPPGMHPPFPQR